jgi:hypothetical protein
MPVSVSGGPRKGFIPIREVKEGGGRLILIEEDSDRKAVARYNDQLATGGRGLVVSTVHPSKLEGRLEGGDIKWLSRARGGLNPSRLDYDVYQEVSRFLREEGVVLLLGIEYLCLVNGFKNVARFVKKVGDRASASGGAFVVSLNPMALDGKEVAVLEKAFDYVERKGLGARVIDGMAKGGETKGWSYLILDKDVFRDLRRFREDAICITTVQPEKVKRWEDFGGEVLWVSESEESKAQHPSKLAFEIRQRVMKAVNEDGKSVFIDGLEHLLMYTDLTEVVNFVKSVSDACAQSSAFMIASIDRRALDKKDLELFKRMFDKVVG